MIITDEDRRYVLTVYRQERARGMHSPAETMCILRNAWAALTAEDVFRGWPAQPEYPRRWAAAEEYARSMHGRPGYWHRTPR